MMVITKISPQTKKGSFNIFIDGNYSFSLSDEDVVKEKITVGKNLNETQLQDLKFKGKFGLFLFRAYNFLSFRPRSEKELLDKLQEFAYRDKELDKETKQKVVAGVLKKVKDLGLVNDIDFAKWYIDQRQKSRKPSGVRKIESELYQKGLKKELLSLTLNKIKKNTGMESERALLAGQKKLRSYEGLSLREFKSKISAFLIRQGYEWEVVLSVVDTLVKRQYNRAETDNGVESD